MTKLVSITLPDTLTQIQNGQFYNCSSLAQILIPSTVTAIQDQAFRSCKALTQVTIPETVTFLGSYAFQDCVNLEKITVPASVATVEAGVFNNCPMLVSAGPLGSGCCLEFGWTDTIPKNVFNGMTKLISIILPDTLTQIQDSQFYNCSSLVQITIPSAVTAIQDRAFRSCKALTQVTIPETVTFLGSYAFQDCVNLEKVTLPASIATVEDNIFNNCPKLTTAGPIGSGSALEFGWTDILPKNVFNGMSKLVSITLPETLTQIKESQFYNCSSLAQIHIPSTVTAIGKNAFRNCKALTQIRIPEGVTSLGANAFQDCTALEQVTLPGTLTSLEEYTFYGCKALNRVSIPEGVTVLKGNAFRGCTGLAEITLPGTLTAIGNEAFRDCKALKEVLIPEGVTDIGSSAFQNCVLLEKVTLPASAVNVKSNVFNSCPLLTTAGPIGSGCALEFGWTDTIPEGLFYGMSGLVSAALPDSLTRIPNSLFRSCTSLAEVTLPGTLIAIGNEAFRDCKALKQLLIPEGVTDIGSSAFQNCVLLEKVTLPESAVNVKNNVFNGCPLLTTAGPIGSGCTLEFGWTDTIPEGMFYGMSGLVSAALPDSLTRIPNALFQNCTALTQITIPGSVTAIGENAFNNCDSLTEVFIPESVTGIGANAFRSCNNLQKLTVAGAATIRSNAFYDCKAMTDISISSLATLEPNAIPLASASGTLGGLSWSVNSKTYTLTISGTGDMILETDEQGQPLPPWAHLSSILSHLVLEDGITSIDAGAFRGFTRIRTVDIPDSVLGVGTNAFAGCTGLESVSLGTSLQALGEDVFAGCDSLTDITVIAQEDLRIGTNAIPNSPDLTITYPEVGSNVGSYLDANCSEVAKQTWDNTLPARDVVLVLDVSGSMDGNRIANLKTAVNLFLDRAGGVLTNSRVAIVSYESSARVVSNFTWSVNRLKGVVNGLSANGGTNYLNALNTAETVLEDSSNEIRAMIFFTDGEPNDNRSSILSKCQELHENYRIYTVGFDPSYSGQELLRKMAGGPDNYYASSDMDSLAEAFKNLAADVGTEVEEEEYYDLTAQRQFVISTKDAGYPAVTGFRIEVDGKVYTSGLSEDAQVFSESIEVLIPEDYTGNVVISREGYVTYAMPIALVGNYNTVTMYPVGNGEPFVQQLLHQANPKKQSYNNCFSHVSIREAGLNSSTGETQRFYVDINWNQHDPGEVWLQQGNARLNLTDGEFLDIPLSSTFTADGGSVYLYYTTPQGFKTRAETNILVTPAKNSLPIDLGESLTIPQEDVSKMHIFGDRKLEIDFSEWSEVPISFTIASDGTISGTIGLRDKEGSALGATVSAKEKTLRETFAKLKKSENMSKKKLNDMLKDLKQEASPKNGKFGLEGKVWLVGYFSGKRGEDGNLEIKEVDAYLIAEGSISYTLPFTLPLIHVPAYFQAQLKGAIQSDLVLHQKEGTLLPLPDVQIDSNITLSLGGGVGVEGVLSGGVQGDGTAGMEIMLMDADETRAYLEAGFSLVGSIIGIKGKWELYHTPRVYFYKHGEFTWTTERTAAARSMRFTPTPEPDHASAFYARGQSVIFDDFDYLLLKSDTTMFSEPQLVSFDNGTRLVVWRDVVTDRVGVDAYGVYYSCFNGSRWSNPCLVEDDGTNDYGLSIVEANGAAYILWHDYDKIFGQDLDQVETAAEHVNISIAKFDSATQRISGHTEFSAGGYDYQPQLHAEDGQLQLAWKSGLLEEEALYLAQSQDGSSWTEGSQADVPWYTDGYQQIPQDYTGPALMNLGSVRNVSNGTLRAIVYRSADLEGVQNIFVVYGTGDTWGLPIQLTYFADGTYVDAFGADMTQDSLELSLNITHANGKSDLAFREFSLGTDLSIVRADYDHFTFAPGKSSVFYARVTNQGPETEDMLKLRLLDAQGKVLKTQLVDGTIASGDTVRLEMNYVIPDDNSLKQLTVSVLPVHTTDVAPENNQMTLDIHYKDISVEEMQAYTSEESTMVIARIVNRGNEDLPMGSYTLHYGTPDGPVVSTGTLKATAPGEVQTLTLTLDPLAGGELLYLQAAEYENENLTSNNQGIVTIQSSSMLMKPRITLDREYIAMQPGQTAALTPEYKPQEASLVWTVEPIDGENVIAVDADGNVTAMEPGSAYVLATVTYAELEATARCRVDVAAPLQIDGVQTNVTKLTSELYSRDYARVQIALLMPQNYPGAQAALRTAAGAHQGVAVTAAHFDNEDLAEVFDLTALDDRNYILVPTQAALNDPSAVKSSYTSTISVTVQDQTFTTEPLTLTVKKALPKLTASVAPFNSFYSGQSQELRITGGTATSITCEALPDWLSLSDSVLTLKENAPRKSTSVKLTLLVQTQEWAIPAKVTVNVRNTYAERGVKLSASSIRLSSDPTASAGVALTLLPKNKKDSLTDLKVIGITAPEGYHIEEFNPLDGSFLLKAQEDFQPGKLRLTVRFADTDVTKDLSLTVKKTNVSLSLSTKTVTLNTATGDTALVRVTATPEDYQLTQPTIRLSHSDVLDAEYKDGYLKISTRENTPAGETYKLYLQAGDSKETVLTVKTQEKAPGASLKVTGSLDLSFPEQAAAAALTFKNLSGGSAVLTQWQFQELQGKTVIDPDVQNVFALSQVSPGTFALTCIDGDAVNTHSSYQLKLFLTLEDGTQLEADTKLPVKRSAVKLKLSKSSLTLNNTIADHGQVQVTCSTKNYRLAEPVLELMDRSGKVSAQGQLDMNYADGKLQLAVNEHTQFGCTYKVLVRANSHAPASTLTVTIPDAAKSRITPSIKVTGTLDVIRDDTFLTVTPSYKNCADGARTEELLFFSSADNYAEPVEGLFTVKPNGSGGYTVAKASGAALDHSLKYRLQLVADFGNEVKVSTKPVNLKLKLGSAKLKLENTEVHLFTRDRNSRDTFRILNTDPSLNDIASVSIKDAKYQDAFVIHSYGDGEYAIGFRDGMVPETGKSVTLTLNVWLEGNETAKPNTTVKLKLVLIP